MVQPFYPFDRLSQLTHANTHFAYPLTTERVPRAFKVLLEQPLDAACAMDGC